MITLYLEDVVQSSSILYNLSEQCLVSIKATTVTVCDTDINGKFYPKKCVMNPNRVGRYRELWGMLASQFHEVMHKLLPLF